MSRYLPQSDVTLWDDEYPLHDMFMDGLSNEHLYSLYIDLMAEISDRQIAVQTMNVYNEFCDIMNEDEGNG